MLRCKEVVKIVSGSTEHLSWSKKMELHLHLMMCKHCSRYVTHLGILSDSFRKLVQKQTTVDREKIAQVEEEIIKKVAK